MFFFSLSSSSYYCFFPKTLLSFLPCFNLKGRAEVVSVASEGTIAVCKFACLIHDMLFFAFILVWVISQWIKTSWKSNTSHIFWLFQNLSWFWLNPQLFVYVSATAIAALCDWFTTSISVLICQATSQVISTFHTMIAGLCLFSVIVFNFSFHASIYMIFSQVFLKFFWNWWISKLKEWQYTYMIAGTYLWSAYNL